MSNKELIYQVVKETCNTEDPVKFCQCNNTVYEVAKALLKKLAERKNFTEQAIDYAEKCDYKWMNNSTRDALFMAYLKGVEDALGIRLVN